MAMRIVFLSYNYSPDIHSPEEWTERLRFYIGWLECLAKEHTVIRVDQVNYTGEFNRNGVHYHCINQGPARDYFPGKLNRFVRSLLPDIVVVSSFLFPLQLIQLRNCLGKGVKIIVQHHAERPFTGIKKQVQYFASRRVDAVLFTSAETGVEWVKKGNIHSVKRIKELMEVSSNFIPVNKNEARHKLLISGSPLYLWVGRLDQNKDPLTAVKAFLKFAACTPGAKLYMIYHTMELLNAVQQLLPADPADSPVILIGKTPNSELQDWFSAADFYLSASHYEGSGTALAEAMSCNCVPICSDIPPFRKITGGCGLLFEPGNEDALYTVLQRTGRLNREETKNAARAHFEKALSFEAIAGTFEEIINSL